MLAGFAVDGSGDDLSVETEAVDVLLERAPARKSVFSRYVELSLMELGGRVAVAQFGETLFRGLLEPSKVGTRRKLAGHRTPASALTGKKDDANFFLQM